MGYEHRFQTKSINRLQINVVILQQIKCNDKSVYNKTTHLELSKMPFQIWKLKKSTWSIIVLI